MDFDHIGNLNETNGCLSNAGGAASWIALDFEFWIDSGSENGLKMDSLDFLGTSSMNFHKTFRLYATNGHLSSVAGSVPCIALDLEFWIDFG